LPFVAALKAATCRQFPSVAVRCSLFGWTINPKVAGSIPARPIKKELLDAATRRVKLRDNASVAFMTVVEDDGLCFNASRFLLGSYPSRYGTLERMMRGSKRSSRVR
jgi:hypothetical protein